jgi:hypothetical protein
MAKQIVKVLSKKSKRAAVVAVRSEFRNKDQVNIREFLIEGTDEYAATKAGFTIPAESFPDFFKAMRKFGRAAGLLGKAGDDDFEIKSLDDLDDDDGDIKIIGKASGDAKDDAPKSKKTGIIRKKKDDDADDEPKGKRGRKAKDEDDEPKGKRGRKAKEDDDNDSSDAFDLKGFKKAIKTAIKSSDSADYAGVVALYKASRKKLKDLLPKHAVNALEKSLANKTNDALLEKAVAACEKHIVEKNFSL